MTTVSDDEHEEPSRELFLPPVDDLGQQLTRAEIWTRLFGPDPDRQPVRVARFEITKRLGQGGMGEVFLGHDPALDRRVAIKLLHPKYTGARARVAAERARREAQALARVSHPNVIEVFEVGEHEGRPFVAMEYVEGQTLGAWLEGRERGWEEIVAAFIEAGRGLQAAHRVDLVHRDFKPDNVLISELDAGGEGRRVRVLDFGLARLTEVEPVRISTLTDSEDSLTQVGALLGTPAYMAPEQLRGESATAASDQFSFCLSLYMALWEEVPFLGRGVRQRLRAMEAGQLRSPPEDADTPRRLWPVIQRGLALSPSARWSDMGALLRELEELLDAPWRRRRRLVGALLLSAGLGLGLGLAFAAEPTPEDPCAHVERRTASLWSEARAAAARVRFEASAAPFAAATFASLDTELARWTDAWTERRAALCEGGDDGGMRAACLDRAHTELSLWIDALVEANDETIVNADLSELPELEACSEARLAFAIPPAPAAIASQVEARRAALAEALVLRGTGRYVEADAALDALERRADELDYPVFEAELAFERALLEVGRSDDQDAALDALVSATKQAERVHHDRLAASGWLISAQRGADDPSGAHADVAYWLDRADTAVGRLGDPGEERARLACAAGTFAGAESGREREARVAFERGLVLLAWLEGRAGEESARLGAWRAICLSGLAEVSEGEEAVELAERALSSAERHFGAGHPQTADYAFELGRLLLAYSMPDAISRSAALFERATNAWTKATPESALARGELAISRAVQAYGASELEAARAHVQRASEIYAKELDDSYYEHAAPLLLAGTIEYRAGNYEAALERYARARPYLVDQPGLDLALADLELNQARSLIMLGRVDEASALLEPLRERREDPNIIEDLALIALLRGEPAQARALLDEADARSPEVAGSRRVLTALSERRAGRGSGCGALAQGEALSEELERVLDLLELSVDERACLGLSARP